MRTLWLSLLAAPLVQAQEVRVLPAPPERPEPVALAERCGAAVSMPEPFPATSLRVAPEAGALAPGGPGPAPMPNLCDGPLALGPAPTDLAAPLRFREGPLPGRPLPGSPRGGPSTLWPRRLDDLGTRGHPDRFDQLRREYDIEPVHPPLLVLPPDPSTDLLRLPPVAPLGEHE